MNEFEQFYELCSSQVMLIETDLNGKILKVNENYEKFCAYTQEELLSQGFPLIRHPRIKDTFYKKMWNDLKHNGKFSSLMYNISKDKKTIVSKNHILPWKDEADNLIGYKSIAIDVTDGYQQRLKLKQQSKYLQSLLDVMSEMILVIEDSKITLANASLLNFFGFSTLTELLEKNNYLYERFKKEEGYLNPKEDWVEKALIAYKNNSYVEVKMDSSLGVEQVFKVFAINIVHTNKIIVTFDDITIISQEKDTLIEAVDVVEWELFDVQSNFTSFKERFEYAINSSKDGFWDIDFRTNKLYLSRDWKRRLGFKPDEKITYKDYTDLIEIDSLPNQINTMLQYIDYNKKNDEEISSRNFSVNYNLKTKDGEIILIEDNGEVLFNEDQNPYRIFGFHRDITQKVQDQNNAIQQSKLASLGEMIGNIAHQWRQPIGAINGIINDLEFEIDLEDLENVSSSRIKEVTHEISEFTSYLSKTIDDFRNFMKEDKTSEEFLLHNNIQDSIKIVEHTFSQNGIVILNKFCNEKVIINGYPRELNQVIVNILNNAKDAIVEKQIKSPIVKIETQIDGEKVNIIISDNAGGIPDNIINKIFDPYFTTKHESIGTGIGLSMSKSIIDNHFKGLLSVSNGDKGAVFNIVLPK